MKKNKHRNRINRRRPQRRTSQQNQKLLVTPLTGPFRPTDVLFYKLGRCPYCNERASDPMVGVNWSHDDIELACYFHPDCATAILITADREHHNDFFRKIELDVACELAQETLAGSGVRR